MKPNFNEMSRAELLAYLKQHRTDDEAWGIYLDGRSPDKTANWYPMPLDEESIRIGEEAIREKLKKLGLSKKREVE